MSEATETATNAVADFAKELGTAAAKATVQTAVEIAAATALLVAFGYTYDRIQRRKAKKNATTTVVPE